MALLVVTPSPVPVQSDQWVQVDGELQPNYGDMSVLAAQSNGLRSGQSYVVVSSVSAADKQSLRAAPTDYAEWVNRYLQLPQGNARCVRACQLSTDGCECVPANELVKVCKNDAG